MPLTEEEKKAIVNYAIEIEEINQEYMSKGGDMNLLPSFEMMKTPTVSLQEIKDRIEILER
jgi:hypothetical protein